MRRLSLADLHVYESWGRAQVRDHAHLSYTSLRSLLEQEHGVTGAVYTMRAWLQWLSKPSKRHLYATAWAEEEAKAFGSRYTRRKSMATEGLESLDNVHYYQTHGSWSYCGGCGRRRFGAAGSPPLSSR